MQVGDLYNPYKIFTGVYIPNAIVKLTALSFGAKVCLGRMLWFASEDGECKETVKKIGDEIGASERSTSDYLRELENFGLIKRTHTQAANAYDFVWHECLENCLRREIKNSKDKSIPIQQDSADVTKTPAGFCCSGQRDSADAYKESEVLELDSKIRFDSSVSENPNSQCEGLDLEDSIENFVKNSASRLRVKVKLDGKANTYAVDKLIKLEKDNTPECVRAGWLACLNWCIGQGDIKSPLGVFLAKPEQYFPNTQNTKAVSKPQTRSSVAPRAAQAPAKAIPQPVADQQIEIPKLEKQLEAANPVQWKQYSTYWTKLNERHKNRNDFSAGHKYLLNLLIDGKVWMYDIEMKHRSYCWSEEWEWKGGVKVPTLYRWLVEEKYKRWEPTFQSQGQFFTEYNRDIKAVEVYNKEHGIPDQKAKVAKVRIPDMTNIMDMWGPQ